jgi:hypothetical protein
MGGAEAPALRYSGRPSSQGRPEPTNLAELLERILDKGIVIAGDISVSLVDIELLTIKLRLLITSVDKAREIGVNWWESDPWLSGRQRDQAAVGSQGYRTDSGVEARLERIESALSQLTAGSERPLGAARESPRE